MEQKLNYEGLRVYDNEENLRVHGDIEISPNGMVIKVKGETVTISPAGSEDNPNGITISKVYEAGKYGILCPPFTCLSAEHEKEEYSRNHCK